MRYKAAYDAYRACAVRVSAKLEQGEHPTADELAEEAKALEALAFARAELLDAITREARS